MEVKNLCKAYGDLPVLENVSFTVGVGVTALWGPSGVGKTTLLRALAGLLPAAGEIRLDGKPVSSYPPRVLARKIAYMHQDTTVPFDFTAAQVVAMGRSPWIGAFAVPSPSDPRVTSAMTPAGGAALAPRAPDPALCLLLHTQFRLR